MALYPYQERVKAYLLAGQSVILQAPTGAGKTRAALAPYLESYFDLAADAFPRKCIYSVPMRVLANQFYAEYKSLAERYERVHQKKVNVLIQTGDHADDPRFCGGLIFATIDQSLSSALGVPYSLSPRLANLNAGAFCSSYLVFDEFHLFPNGGEGEAGIDGALVTTLQLLQQLKGTVPFVLMTATFSSTMLARLADLLDAEVVSVSREEYAMIATRNGETIARSRTFQVHDAPLTAADVLATHQQRSIVVCNQVQRAQELYAALVPAAIARNIELCLLHSRFTAEDRAQKEQWVRQHFARGGGTGKSLILVATQVIEVGVDITCEHLHTEIAPANAILQRAGRCARYPGEQGMVHIYRVPMRAALPATSAGATASSNENEVNNHQDDAPPRYDYLPYPAQLGEASWQSFAARHGQTVDFEEEQRIIDEVHTDADRQLLDAMARQSARIWQEITTTLDKSDTAMRSTLIRRIDNIKVLVATDPDNVGNPFAAEGFGLFRGTVAGIFTRLQQQQIEQHPDALEGGWQMQYPIIAEPDPDDPTKRMQVTWHEVPSAQFLAGTQIVVINRAFCAYDAELGFRIVEPPEATEWVSPPGKFAAGNRVTGNGYQLESYTDHIGKMLRVFARDFADDYAYLERRLSEQETIPPGGLTRAIRLAIACHDLAKLDTRWQQWVNAYQKAIGEPLPSANYMAVHNHWNSDDPKHQEAQKTVSRQHKRPHHAAESAVAASLVIEQIMDDIRLEPAIYTAIARHHSPTTKAYEDYELHPGGTHALYQAISLAGFSTNAPVKTKEIGWTLDDYLIDPTFGQQLIYLLIVRMLRLCDGLSQEE